MITTNMDAVIDKMLHLLSTGWSLARTDDISPRRRVRNLVIPTLLALLAPAYGCGQDASPTPVAVAVPLATSLPASTPTAIPLPAPKRLITAVPTAIPPQLPSPMSTPVPTATPAPRVGHVQPDLFSGGPRGGAASGGDVDAASVEDVLDRGLRLAGGFPVHIVIRGTASNDSVRCERRGIARTQAQRDSAIRFAKLVRDARNQRLGISPDLLEFLLDINEAAGNTREAGNVLQGVDVTFKEGALPAGSVTIPTDIKFNTCLDGGVPDPDDNSGTRPFFAYATAVHEAGHALGLSNFSYYDLLTEGFWESIIGILEYLESLTLPLLPFLHSLLVVIQNFLEIIGLARDQNYQPWEVAHPSIPDAVLNYDHNVYRYHPEARSGFSEPDCSPHPFDVMAIYSLYQTVP